MTVAFASEASAGTPFFGVADAVRVEKLSWYREVLVLEPGSKIFLPFARLLDELGRTAETVQVLRDGLDKHPEFIEARLFLIDVLHKSGQPELCGAEVARLAGLFREYPGFWDAWSAQELGHKPDLSVSLSFLGAMFRDCDITFVDVLSAGIKALQNGAEPLTAQPAPISSHTALVQDTFASPKRAEKPVLDAPFSEIFSSPEITAAIPLFAMSSGIADESDAAPDRVLDTDIVTMDSPPPFVFKESQSLAGRAAPAEEKCSLRTRSMAEVLAEQGDVRGAVEIYDELLQTCQAVDLPSLQARLDDLRARLGDTGTAAYAGHQAASASAHAPVHASASQSVPFTAQPKSASVQPRNGVLDLLEKLAVRLETKARQ